MKDGSQKANISLAAVILPINAVYFPGSPGVHWWIYVTEVPLIRRNLSVRVHIVFTQQND